MPDPMRIERYLGVLMPELTPQDISNQQFRSVFRGFDPAEVRSYLDGLAQSVAQLASEREALNERLAEVGERDLKSEFESIGREVAAVLEAAREAADQLRQRASNDATRWRSEAVAEAEQSLRQARSDSERLRGDAWSTADELLKQVMAEADRIQATTEKERLRLVGEAERESHRVVAAGRREAEDVLRNAKMESERLTLTAQTNHDEMIEQATRQADAAQERTRALEIRRQELKAELDSIRHALATAEGELEERRSALALSPQTPPPAASSEALSETASDAPEKKEGEWTPGETVRVVRPGGGASQSSRSTVVGPLTDSPEIVLLSSDEILKRRREEAGDDTSVDDVEDSSVVASDEVDDEQTQDEPSTDEPSTDDSSDDESTGDGTTDDSDGVQEALEPDAIESVEGESVADDGSGAAEADAPEHSTPDDAAKISDQVPDAPTDGEEGRFEELSGLFARLREPSERKTVPVDDTVASSQAPEEPTTLSVDYDGDAMELRSRLLLPVSNRALRNIKRQLTEAQNEALEELRLSDGAWEPDGPALGARLRPDLVVLAAESYAAGHAAAMEMADTRFKRPSTPKTEPENDWVAALLQDLNHALGEGRKQGQGSRELGASVSRVFRSWRTDEAERRVGDLAAERYHTGFADVLLANDFTVRWVVSGRGCATCKSNAESVPGEWESVPPAHANCGCALIIV